MLFSIMVSQYSLLTHSILVQGVHESEEAAVNKEMKEMNVLKDCIIKQGRHCLITWLQANIYLLFCLRSISISVYSSFHS